MSRIFYLSSDSCISSSAYLQHCKTNRLKDMLFSAATLLSFSNKGSVKRTVRAILALFSSLSILNIFITHDNIMLVFGYIYITIYGCIGSLVVV